MTELDPNNVQTRNNRPVIIHTTNGCNPGSPWVGEWMADNGVWYAGRWNSWGTPKAAGDPVLKAKPRRIQGWINVYPSPSAHWQGDLANIWTSRAEADDSAGPDRINCLYVEFEESEGL